MANPIQIGALLGLDVHYIEASATRHFEDGRTACERTASRPPAGCVEGYSAQFDLALATDWSRVTCKDCLKQTPPDNQDGTHERKRTTPP